MSTQIHPTAIIDPKAKLGEGVCIGPYCILEGEVELGAGTHLHSHVVVSGPTRLGARNEIFPFAIIGGLTQDLKYKGEPTYCEIGDDNVFREYCTIHRGTGAGEKTVVGSRNHLLAYTHVAHNCVLGNNIIMSNCGTLAGHVTVGDGAVVGGLAAVHQFCRIGTLSMIGGCAKVVQDVPPFMIVDGNPSEVRAPNKIGMERAGMPEPAQKAVKDAYRIIFRSRDMTTTQALDLIDRQFPDQTEVRVVAEFIRSSQRGVCR